MTDQIKQSLIQLGINKEVDNILREMHEDKLDKVSASQKIKSLIESAFPGENVNGLQILVLALQYDKFKGKMAVGKVTAGSIKKGMPIQAIQQSGSINGRVTSLSIFDGLKMKEVEEAKAGEIVMVAGLETVDIGDTIVNPEFTKALPRIEVDAPTIRMTFGVNTSPFAGKEGKLGTSRQIRDRLMKELETNIALRVEDSNSADKFIVSGRGELHLSVLIETMRREGFEFEVSKPEVIIKTAEELGL